MNGRSRGAQPEATTASTTEQQIKQVLDLLDALESGKTTPQKLRKAVGKAAAGLSSAVQESAMSLVDCAVMLYISPTDKRAAPAVCNPRFRKGTAMQPVPWSTCLWKPPQLSR